VIDRDKHLAEIARLTPSREKWGTYCQHGKKVVEMDPDRTDAEGYPVGRIVEPWPCNEDGCTREALEKDAREEEEAYWAERWSEYYSQCM
jgi:hypothetical protein